MVSKFHAACINPSNNDPNDELIYVAYLQAVEPCWRLERKRFHPIDDNTVGFKIYPKKWSITKPTKMTGYPVARTDRTGNVGWEAGESKSRVLSRD